MANLYIASIYLSGIEGVEYLTALNSISIKKQIHKTLKDYIGAWYPEFFDKIRNTKTIDYIAEDDEEFYTLQINRIIKFLTRHEEINLSIIEVYPTIQNNKITEVQHDIIPLGG